MPKVGRETIHWAMELFARENPIHPVRLMLRTREIGVRQPILHNWLTSALGVPSDAYHNEVGRRFTIAMVARIMEPGCQCRLHARLWKARRGSSKASSAGRSQAPSISPTTSPSLNGDQVRTSMHIRGKWLIEISELAAFNKIVGRRDAESLHLPALRKSTSPNTGERSGANPANACSSARPTPTIGSRTKPAPAASGRSRSSTSTSNGWPSTATSFSPKRSKPTTLANRGGPTPISSAASSPPTKRSANSTTTGPIRRWSWQGRLTVVTIAQIWVGMGSITHGGDLTKFDMHAQKRIAAILKRDGYEKARTTGGRIVWKKSEENEPSDPCEPFSPYVRVYACAR